MLCLHLCKYDQLVEVPKVMPQEEQDAAIGGQASARLKRTFTINSGGLVPLPGRTSEPTRLRTTS